MLFLNHFSPKTVSDILGAYTTCFGAQEALNEDFFIKSRPVFFREMWFIVCSHS